MISLIKSISKYSLLILLGIAVGLLCLEFGVRMMGAKPETYLRKFSQYHPVFGWVKTPNMEGEFRRGDIKIHEKMNSRGLRDIEYEYVKPDSTIRILVLGDSFTEGYDVDFQNIFTEILERKLNEELSPATKYKYEVINAGTGGYSTDQEYLYYQLEGYKYQPDVVILMTYATNDIYYNIEAKYGNYSKPLFAIQNDSLYLTNTPLPEPRRQESIKDFFRDMALYPIVTGIILKRFPSVAVTLSKWGFVSKSTLETTKSVSGVSSKEKYPSSFQIFEREQPGKISDAWHITDLLIRDLNSLTRANEGRFLLFSIPDRFQVYEDSWADTKARYYVNDSVWDPNLPDSLLSVTASRYGIPFLNMKNYLHTTHADKEPLYNGVHWNVRGNEVAAEFIYQELIRNALVKQ